MLGKAEMLKFLLNSKMSMSNNLLADMKLAINRFASILVEICRKNWKQEQPIQKYQQDNKCYLFHCCTQYLSQIVLYARKMKTMVQLQKREIFSDCTLTQNFYKCLYKQENSDFNTTLEKTISSRSL